MTTTPTLQPPERVFVVTSATGIHHLTEDEKLAESMTELGEVRTEYVPAARLEETERACESYKLSWQSEQRDAIPLRDVMVAARRLIGEAVGPADPPRRGSALEGLYLALRAFDAALTAEPAPEQPDLTDAQKLAGIVLHNTNAWVPWQREARELANRIMGGFEVPEQPAQPAEPAGDSGEQEWRTYEEAWKLSCFDHAAFQIHRALSGEPVTVEEGPLREALESVRRANGANATLAEQLRQMHRALTEATELAQERMDHANQLQADIEAEQAGRLELRKRHGALEHETFGMFIERVVSARESEVQRLTARWEETLERETSVIAQRDLLTEELRVLKAEHEKYRLESRRLESERNALANWLDDELCNANPEQRPVVKRVIASINKIRMAQQPETAKVSPRCRLARGHVGLHSTDTDVKAPTGMACPYYVEQPEVAKADPGPQCINCGQLWVPPEGVDATCVRCPEYQPDDAWGFHGRARRALACGNQPLALSCLLSSVAQVLQKLETEDAKAGSLTVERCPVARANTDGRFYCSREVGHEGPCAARQAAPDNPGGDKDPVPKPSTYLEHAEAAHKQGRHENAVGFMLDHLKQQRSR